MERETKSLTQIVDIASDQTSGKNKQPISTSVSDTKIFDSFKTNDQNILNLQKTTCCNGETTVRELFLENNINDSQERKALLKEGGTPSNEESTNSEIELRSGVTLPRKEKTQTAVISQAFSFLPAATEEELDNGIELVRIPPEGCESLEQDNGSSANQSIRVGNHSDSMQTLFPHDELSSFNDDNDEEEDEVANYSRCSMEIDGCESDDDILTVVGNNVADIGNKGVHVTTIPVSLSKISLKTDALSTVTSEPTATKDTTESCVDNKSSSVEGEAGVSGNDIKEHSAADSSKNSESLNPEESLAKVPENEETKVSKNEEAVNNDDKPDGECSSFDNQNGVVIRRRQSGRKKKAVAKDTELSDDSSDEDSGIYAESHRNSRWIQVVEEEPTGDKMTIAEKTMSEQIPTGKLLRLVSEDDTVFSEGCLTLPMTGHKRSESTSTTLSETEFVRQRSYRSRRRCLIRRQESQQEYHRLSAKVYDQEKLIVVEKSDTDTDFGLHILDSHPAFITSVDPGSPSERCGVQEGQIVISVNGVNTLELSHEEIVKLVQKYEKKVQLEVAYSDFQPVRDLEKSIMSGFMLKLGTSTLMKIWKKRYFVLRQDNCLYYYKNEQELDPLGAIPLSGYCISRYIDTSKDYCFKAEKYGARTYYFMTDSRSEMSQWVGVLTDAAARCKKRKDSWLEVSSHNVGLPALEIRKPECTGLLTKMGLQHKTWQKRYCVLKDACIYYYKSMSSLSAKGVVHLHGYTVDASGYNNKRFSFILNPPCANMRTFYFCADNQTDKQRWVDSLIRSIQRWIQVDNS